MATTSAEQHRAAALERLEIEERLIELGQRRHQALAAADEALGEIRGLMHRAAKAGIGVTDVAKLTGVSRPTLYRD